MEDPMRKLVLLICTLFALPVAAAELECTNALTQPSDTFIQVAAEQHTHLDEDQISLVGAMYQLAYDQYQLANDQSLPEQDREFALRTQQIAMQMIAIQLHVFDTIPKMENVLERMQAEIAHGLTMVSTELAPDVRRIAVAMVAIGLAWADFNNDVVQLSTNRFVAAIDYGNISDTQQTLQRSLCIIQTSMSVMDGVVNFFPTAIKLAYVEQLYY
jgi:hypothetical protein